MRYSETNDKKVTQQTYQAIKNSLIMKRLNTAKDDWNYEIIYPIDYDGVFNQM